MLSIREAQDRILAALPGVNGATAGGKTFNAGMRGQKTTYYEGGHRAACFIRWPHGNLGKPRDIDELTQVQDLFPTLVGLCGIDLAKSLGWNGVSMTGLLRGTHDKLPERTLVVQYGEQPGGQKLDLSLRADDDLPELDLTRRAATYSYKDGDNFVFMDAEDYTQYLLGPDLVGDQAGYVTEGLEGCFVMLRDEQPISLQLPAQVVLEVIDTAPELRGATATKRPKPAKLSTGIEIQVPEYIVVGEKVRVSTETGEFAGRA